MPEPDMLVFYVIYDDGSVETQTMTDRPGAAPALNKPGRVTSKAEYDQYKSVLDEHNNIWVAELRAQEQHAMKTDYDALIAAGIPEATARRITGYNGT